MGRRIKVSYEERLDAVERHLRHECSMSDLAKQLKVARTAIRQWISRYQAFGSEGLQDSCRNLSYSSTLKEAAVLDYLSGNYSQLELCGKYGMKSTTQLRKWITKYNGHEKLKSSGTGGLIMTQGRKTSFEERVEIVQYCIEQQNNYAESARKYHVSYQQVYSWTTKFETQGVEALQDKRGKRTPLEKMSELEKLKAENELLEAKNKRQQMEIDFLKKLEEIERRRF
jgi:transposase